MPAPSSVPAPSPHPNVADFRRACGRFATGICVATTVGADGTPQGLTVNSFTSVSAVPPIVLVCIDHRCSALPAFRSSSVFGISVLSASQRELSVRFSQCDGNRFHGIEWQTGISGVPLLAGALATLECNTSHAMDAGDHTVFFGEVSKVTYAGGEPLVFFGSRYRTLLQDMPDPSLS